MKLVLIGVAVLVLASFMLGSCSSKRTKDIRNEMGVKLLPNGNRVYEIEFDSIEYIVVERHNGIGICKK